MKADELRALADRVEKLEAPDREGQEELAKALGYKPERNHPDPRGWHSPDGYYCEELPDWLASLDAAMTLVPEGWAIDSIKEGEVGSWYVNIRPRNWVSGWWYGKGASPALALTAAALRAQAAMMETSDESR